MNMNPTLEAQNMTIRDSVKAIREAAFRNLDVQNIQVNQNRNGNIRVSARVGRFIKADPYATQAPTADKY